MAYPEPTVFGEVLNEVLTDLRLGVFPRFTRSPYYQLYLRCKSIEERELKHTDFELLKVLGVFFWCENEHTRTKKMSFSLFFFAKKHTKVCTNKNNNNIKKTHIFFVRAWSIWKCTNVP